MSKVINEFLSRYEKEFDFYINLAGNVEIKIKNELSKNGVRTIVSSRAKSISRLDVKLEDRNRKKNYKTVSDIYEDIADLAGVRVALYFPGDMKVVEDIIKRNFKIRKTKWFPEDNGKKKIGDYQKIFDGYSAVHFRVSLNDESRYGKNHCVEIQVASVLMHAWSEVEHDLIYKPLQGDLSHEELMILDEINGLVLSGNIALERLQKAGQQRVNNNKSELLLNHYDLASYLITNSSEINEEIFDFRTLFTLLSLMGLNNKARVKGILEHISSEKNNKKRRFSHSIDVYSSAILELYPDEVISIFTSGKINDAEVFAFVKDMVWDFIRDRDGRDAIDMIIKNSEVLHFELSTFGREFLGVEYKDVLSFDEIGDQELDEQLMFIDTFKGKMNSGRVTKAEISEFISLCESYIAH